jgi:ChaB
MPGREDLPSTLRRSPEKAQETWIKTHDSAVEEYGEGERAHRTAYGSLKHGFEKVGDHWEPKEGGRKGPSDEQSARPRGSSGESFGGVDANASKQGGSGTGRPCITGIAAGQGTGRGRRSGSSHPSNP